MWLDFAMQDQAMNPVTLRHATCSVTRRHAMSPVMPADTDEREPVMNYIELYSSSIRLHHPLDGITYPKYKLLRLLQLTIFLQR
jgi:hypothetical protein